MRISGTSPKNRHRAVGYVRRSTDRQEQSLFGSVQSVGLYDLGGSGAMEQVAADIRAYWPKRTAPAKE